MLTLVIDLECETFDEYEDKSEQIGELVQYIAGMVGKGYMSGYEPRFYIEDSEADQTMKYLGFLRDQMNTARHISDEDMEKIVVAVDEIEALRAKMLKERK